jgi:hypothetical protein
VPIYDRSTSSADGHTPVPACIALTHNYVSTSNLYDVLKFLKYKPEQISGLRGCDEDTGEHRMEMEMSSKDYTLTAESFYSVFVEKLKDVMLPQHYEQFVESFVKEDDEKRKKQNSSSSFVDLLSCYDKKKELRRKRKYDSNELLESRTISKKTECSTGTEKGDGEMRKQCITTDAGQTKCDGEHGENNSSFAFSFDL